MSLNLSSTIEVFLVSCDAPFSQREFDTLFCPINFNSTTQTASSYGKGNTQYTEVTSVDIASVTPQVTFSHASAACIAHSSSSPTHLNTPATTHTSPNTYD